MVAASEYGNIIFFWLIHAINFSLPSSCNVGVIDKIGTQECELHSEYFTKICLGTALFRKMSSNIPWNTFKHAGERLKLIWRTPTNIFSIFRNEVRRPGECANTLWRIWQSILQISRSFAFNKRKTPGLLTN